MGRDPSSFLCSFRGRSTSTSLDLLHLHPRGKPFHHPTLIRNISRSLPLDRRCLRHRNSGTQHLNIAPPLVGSRIPNSPNAIADSFLRALFPCPPGSFPLRFGKQPERA